MPSNWGDDRHTQQEYSNQNTNALQLTVQSDRHVTEGADLGACPGFRFLGSLEGLLQIENTNMRCKRWEWKGCSLWSDWPKEK